MSLDPNENARRHVGGFDAKAIKDFIDSTPAGKRLTKQEELELIKKAQAGCNESKQALVTASYRVIVSEVTKFVRKHRHGQVNEESLFLSAFNNAVIKLYDAIDRFDFSYGTRFITFAMSWIRLGIRKEIFEDARRYRPIRNFQDPTEASFIELEDDMPILDKPGFDHKTDIKSCLMNVVNNGVLSETERFVIKGRYGIEGYEHTADEIAKLLRKPTKEITDIENRALRKLFVRLRPDVIEHEGF